MSRTLPRIFAAGIITLFAFTFVGMTQLAQAADPAPALTAAEALEIEPTGGIVPDCDPTLSPSQPGACGVTAFLQLIKNVIRYLSYIAFPLAAAMIGWGGFQVMTAAGSEERVSSGYKSMRIAAIGIIFILISYLIVQAIFKLLGVEAAFTPGGI